MIYIATFYSHFGAIRYKKLCEQAGMKAKLMPVPRDLSSSCGTCVRYEGENILEHYTDEMEQVVQVSENGYVCLYRAENA